MNVELQTCPRCTWPYPGYHICHYDLRTPEGLEMAKKVGPVRKGHADNEGGYIPAREVMTEDQRTKIGQAVREARSRDPKRIERNLQIIKLYDEEELGMNEISRRMSINFKTVSNVLRAAEREGDVVIRRGATGRTRRAIG